MKCAICGTEDVVLVLPDGKADHLCLPCLLKHRPVVARQIMTSLEGHVSTGGETKTYKCAWCGVVVVAEKLPEGWAVCSPGGGYLCLRCNE